MIYMKLVHTKNTNIAASVRNTGNITNMINLTRLKMVIIGFFS